MLMSYISGIITCVIGLFTVFIGFKDKLLDKVFDEITELIGVDYRIILLIIFAIYYLILELIIVCY